MVQRNPTEYLESDRALAQDFASIPAYVRYGVSQALVRAAAIVRRVQPWQIFYEAFATKGEALAMVPLHGSCGGDWDSAVDRMLSRHVPYLPQGQFEDLPGQIGKGGERLLQWVEDVQQRVKKFNYSPVLTLDFHGALSQVFQNDLNAVARYLIDLTRAAKPLVLHVESPVEAKTFEEFSMQMKDLRARGLKAKLIADEWANTPEQVRELPAADAIDEVHLKMPDLGTLSECVEAVGHLKRGGKFCLLGGSCTETVASAELSAHLASVVKPDSLLVKPGMGFDEGYSLMFNTMMRNLAESASY